jgi:hypothetical protein
MNDSRPITHAEIQFFSESGTGKGEHCEQLGSSIEEIFMICILVPVIAVFTKSEALEIKAISMLEKNGFSYNDAILNAPQHARENLQNAHLALLKEKYPPQGHIYVQGQPILWDS